MADTWTTITEAVATAVGTGVLLIGGVTAALYGRKATPAVEATAFIRPEDGYVILSVKASVTSPGVLPINIPTGDHAPLVRVVEALDGGGTLHPGAVYEAHPPMGGESVGGGESIARTVPFYQPPPTVNLAGWRVTFILDVHKRRPSRHYWSWLADCFVPVPDLPPDRGSAPRPADR